MRRRHLARGPLGFLRHVADIVRKNELGLLATSMAFATVLAVMPLLAVSLSVFLFVEPLEPYLRDLEAIILEYLLSSPGSRIVSQVERTISQMRSSVMGGTGLVFLIGVAMKLLNDIDTAVQRVWGVRHRKHAVRSLLSYVAIIVLGPLLLALLIAVLSVDVLPYFGRIPTRIVAYLVLTATLFSVYHFVPRHPVKLKASLATTAGSAVLLAVVQRGYAWVTANVLNYNRIYGSLAVIPLFLIWVLLFWAVFLLGNATCAALTHRAEHARERPPRRRIP